MFKRENPIAIIDSGVGGLTVVKELQALMPQETIIYLGDNKNVPYGSKSQEEIVNLTKNMLDFLVEKKVKLVGIGCNTISTVLSLLTPDYDFKIIGIIDPVVSHIARLPLTKVGLIATPFTVKTQYYNQTLASLNENMEIIGEDCPHLAELIDQGNYTKNEIDSETKKSLLTIKNKGGQSTVILGCTHYPIVKEYLQELYPDTNFINPAYYQALAIKDYLMEQNICNDTLQTGNLEVYTSGDTKNYLELLNRLGINNVKGVNKVEVSLR